TGRLKAGLALRCRAHWTGKGRASRPVDINRRGARPLLASTGFGRKMGQGFLTLRFACYGFSVRGAYRNVTRIINLGKAKPVARRGRKAMGLRELQIATP